MEYFAHPARLFGPAHCREGFEAFLASSFIPSAVLMWRSAANLQTSRRVADPLCVERTSARVLEGGGRNPRRRVSSGGHLAVGSKGYLALDHRRETSSRSCDAFERRK
jgi:hypothetical protein